MGRLDCCNIHVILNSGDCCTPSTTVSVVDTGGYISQCHFELSDGKPVEPVNVVKDEHNTASTPVCKSVLCLIFFFSQYYRVRGL